MQDMPQKVTNESIHNMILYVHKYIFGYMLKIKFTVTINASRIIFTQKHFSGFLPDRMVDWRARYPNHVPHFIEELLAVCHPLSV